MKAVLWSIGVAALLCAAPSTSRAAATPQAGSASAQSLQDRIEDRFDADATLKHFDIDVSVTNGVATLTGTVATAEDRRRAETLATISGISRVQNNIIVDAQAANKSTADAIVDKTKEGVETAADKTKEALSKTGEVITDAWITSRIHTQFVGVDLLKDSDVDVDTSNHVVTVKGRVLSEAGRAKALEIARTTEGVHRVVDQLTIGPKPMK